MEWALCGLLALGVASALYALGRLHGRQDLVEAKTEGYQAGHQAGWHTAYQGMLAWYRDQQPRRVSRNARPALYGQRVLRDADDTVQLHRVA